MTARPLLILLTAALAGAAQASAERASSLSAPVTLGAVAELAWPALSTHAHRPAVD